MPDKVPKITIAKAEYTTLGSPDIYETVKQFFYQFYMDKDAKHIATMELNGVRITLEKVL